MEPHDLRIGNLYNSVKFKVPVTLELSDLYQLEIDCDGAELDEEIIGRMLEPIPLTVQWIERLGFKYSNGVSWGMNEGLFGLCIDDDDSDEWFAVYWHESYLCDIYYVHDLQNLYSDLTGLFLTIQNKNQ